MTHISSPWVAKQGKVFIRVKTEDGEYWRPCLEDEAQEDEIITCIYCDEPAMQLDHHWPYCSDYNLCAFHSAPTGWVKTRWGKKWHWVEKGKYACSFELRHSGRVRPA
ncbi:unnamed protein product, partial [marine sediment metagenome]